MGLQQLGVPGHDTCGTTATSMHTNATTHGKLRDEILRVWWMCLALGVPGFE